MLPPKKISALIVKFSESMAAGMLAAMFFVFILQIVSRYVFVSPLGWTLELCLTLWVWLVFFGNAFIVRHRDHVTFDIAYQRVSPGMRRLFALAGAAAIVICMAAAFLPTWDFIDFLKIKRSATLGVSMRAVFSIYALFMLAVIIIYATRFFRILRRGLPAEEEGHTGDNI